MTTIMQRALVTGVWGFCGRHLVNRLSAELQASIYGIDIHPVKPRRTGLHQYTRVDITDENQVNDLVQSVKPEAVFHLAGISRGPSLQVYRVNLLGSIHLLEAVRKFAPQARVLMVGSAAEYGHVPEEDMPIRETRCCNPDNPYGISKYAATLAALHYVRSYGLKVVLARPFNIIGACLPSSLVIGAILERIKKAFQAGQEPFEVPVGNLETERDFIAVEDIVAAYLNMINGDFWGEVFNICSGEPRSVRSLIKSLLVNADRPIHLRVDPALVRPTDVQRVFGSPEKAHLAFGFAPKVPLEEALKAAWDSQFPEALGEIR
jgi:GDP-4-dehydro-6-deoxy-D-mannose reductase